MSKYCVDLTFIQLAKRTVPFIKLHPVMIKYRSRSWVTYPQREHRLMNSCHFWCLLSILGVFWEGKVPNIKVHLTCIQCSELVVFTGLAVFVDRTKQDSPKPQSEESMLFPLVPVVNQSCFLRTCWNVISQLLTSFFHPGKKTVWDCPVWHIALCSSITCLLRATSIAISREGSTDIWHQPTQIVMRTPPFPHKPLLQFHLTWIF